jgi:hypothetical protein
MRAPHEGLRVELRNLIRNVTIAYEISAKYSSTEPLELGKPVSAAPLRELEEAYRNLLVAQDKLAIFRKSNPDIF